MAIITRKKDDRSYLTPIFRVFHFSCHGDGCCDTVLIDERLVQYLQQIRTYFGKPLYINSAYRCAVHNRKVGGSANSYHTKGQAADIVVQGVSPAEVARYAESIGVPGIGLYETAKDGYFVHVDTRSIKAFWYGQAEEARSTFGSDPFDGFLAELQCILAPEAEDNSADRILAVAPTVSASCQSHSGIVKAVQVYLAATGYEEVGTADGIAGPKFTAALKHFQQDRGCDATGTAEQWGKTWHKLLRLEERRGL